MEIRFECNGASCRQHVAVDEAWAGRFIKCPKCGCALEVPKVGEQAAVLPPRHGGEGEDHAALDEAAKPLERKRDTVERLVDRCLRSVAAVAGWASRRRERCGVAIIALATVFTVARVTVNFVESRRIERTTAEICAVGEFRDAPMGDHSGKRIAFIRNTESARTLFLKFGETEEPKALLDVRLDEMKRFSLFGWSPKDRYLVAAQRIDRLSPTPALYLFDGNSGNLVIQATNLPPIVKLVWLGEREFVFQDNRRNRFKGVITDDDGAKVSYEELQRGDLRRDIDALVAMEDRKVGIVRDNNLWSLDIDTRELTQLSSFTNRMTFEWLDYSPKQKAFLFCSPADPPRRFPRVLYRFDPAGDQRGVPRALNDIHTYNGRWILDGRGYAYVGTEGNENFLTVHAEGDAQDRCLFEAGFVRAFSVDAAQRRLLAFASRTIEPHGVWSYDIVERKLENPVLATNTAFAEAKILRPHNKTQQTRGKRPLPYTLIPPRDFKVGKKYPAVVDGPNSQRWRPEPQAIANAGIFYVSANRWGLASSDNFYRAADDIAKLRETLARHPGIDQDRIFLMGTSYGTRVMIPLIREYPELWRGVILHSPVVNLELHEDFWRNPRYLITIGENDRFHDEVRKFEIDACHHWTPVDVRTYPGMGHGVASTEQVRDRVTAAIAFIRSL